MSWIGKKKLHLFLYRSSFDSLSPNWTKHIFCVASISIQPSLALTNHCAVISTSHPYGKANLEGHDDINDLFSKLLDLDFLDYVHKLNDIDQTRFVLDGHPIPIEYGKLKEAQQIRNEIVHELNDINLSNWKILSLWDNLLAIMDVSVSVFLSASDPNLRSSLDSDYQWGIERENRKRIYKLYSEKIIQHLNEKDQIHITKDQNGYNISANQIRLSSDDQVLADNIKWIISKMLKKNLLKFVITICIQHLKVLNGSRK
jgi:hypothetical protein